MPAFEYTALDNGGIERRGVLEGDSARLVRQALREQGLLPVEVAPITARSTGPARRSFEYRRKHIRASELALLTRQLATLVKAGLPLEEGLLAVSEQSESPIVRRTVAAVRARVVEGAPLAEALGSFPRVFPEIYRATVAAGEQSGRLDTVLERLADYTENRDRLRQRILGALLYPIVLTVMSLAIVTGLLTYVVPQVVEVFEAGGDTLPLATRILLAGSAFVREAGPWIAVVLALGLVLFLRWIKAPQARRRVDAVLLRVPLAGRILRGLESARFTRTFSILTGSAVPVLESMRIAGAVIGNLPMREAVAMAAERVREGAPIGRSLALGKIFPPMLVHLISSGESSGRLVEMLERAADNQERELDGLLTSLVGLLGPLLIVAMGVIVLAIVFAMLMPIFEMNTLIR